MPYYIQRGTIPNKRHVQFRRPDGALYSEEVFGTEGFAGPTSTLYHIHPPTQVSGWKAMQSTSPEYVETDVLRMRHMLSWKMKAKGDPVSVLNAEETPAWRKLRGELLSQREAAAKVAAEAHHKVNAQATLAMRVSIGRGILGATRCGSTAIINPRLLTAFIEGWLSNERNNCSFSFTVSINFSSTNRNWGSNLLLAHTPSC